MELYSVMLEFCKNNQEIIYRSFERSKRISWYILIQQSIQQVASNKAIMYCYKLSFPEILDWCDIYFENNLEDNALPWEHIAEEL